MKHLKLTKEQEALKDNLLHKTACVSNSDLIGGLAPLKVGDRVTCTAHHNGRCLPDGIGVIDRLIPPDSAYIRAENGDAVGTRELASLKGC